MGESEPPIYARDTAKIMSVVLEQASADQVFVPRESAEAKDKYVIDLLFRDSNVELEPPDINKGDEPKPDKFEIIQRKLTSVPKEVATLSMPVLQSSVPSIVPDFVDRLGVKTEEVGKKKYGLIHPKTVILEGQVDKRRRTLKKGEKTHLADVLKTDQQLVDD